MDTFGRAISYTVLALILYLGASTFQIARFFQSNGKSFLGQLLISLGILMLDVIKSIFRFWKPFTDDLKKIKEEQLVEFAFNRNGICLSLLSYSGALYLACLYL
jgi:sulfite exporter TauE/SafE